MAKTLEERLKDAEATLKKREDMLKKTLDRNAKQLELAAQRTEASEARHDKAVAKPLSVPKKASEELTAASDRVRLCNIDLLDARYGLCVVKQSEKELAVQLLEAKRAGEVEKAREALGKLLSPNGTPAVQPESQTKWHLQLSAKALGVTGTARMNVAELKAAIEAATKPKEPAAAAA